MRDPYVAQIMQWLAKLYLPLLFCWHRSLLWTEFVLLHLVSLTWLLFPWSDPWRATASVAINANALLSICSKLGSLQAPPFYVPDHTLFFRESADSAKRDYFSQFEMGLMSILKKMKQKEKDVRLLMLYPLKCFPMISLTWAIHM